MKKYRTYTKNGIFHAYDNDHDLYNGPVKINENDVWGRPDYDYYRCRKRSYPPIIHDGVDWSEILKYGVISVIAASILAIIMLSRKAKNPPAKLSCF